MGEVFSKQSIGQGFKRRVEPDYQSSEFLKQPKASSKSPKPQNEATANKQQTEKQMTENKQQHKNEQKKHKKEKKHKQKKKVKKAEEPVPVDDDWNVDFGADTNEQNAATNGFDASNQTNDALSNDDFFGSASGQNDIFGTVED